MNTCETCKHWQPEDEDGGLCRLTLSEGGFAINPQTLAYALDDEGYGAELRTKRNFGCVQHEPVGGEGEA